MPSVLITGANRGLGLEFCRQYADAGWKVIACCRNPAQAEALNALRQSHDFVQIEALDVADFGQIDDLSKTLLDASIDVLINNAGVYDDQRGNGFGQLDYQAWQHSLLINTLAPVKMAESFSPQIKRSGKKLIVNISSLMGSLADNGSGGSILYRSSKAALNASMKSLSIDLMNQNIGVLILHPGWVQTDMGGANALIDSKTSVSGMRAVIDGFTLAQSGAFIKYDGTPMPW
ncbi:C-factor CsgA [Methyloglobulus morosus KoM1]|uniref:C-factor CsgA n=1 Tax=Methyloglobulus morosus KoM1 TaxID=1116472 RepID=V5BFZ3_9GAMM|nr:SDR family oxidoreductase [Methyloglobulus morosus]ESS72210.1 C-factor CsgA [Methyloglobulus morosus KoM1]